MPRPVKLIHVLITACILALSITLLSEFVYSETGIGYEDFGFPLPWKRVYGGADARINYLNLAADFIIWTITIFVILVITFRYAFKWKP
ncbi:MAG: hypothetical protein QXH03_07675 [Candidatus Bathyarchaeia archaeon]